MVDDAKARQARALLDIEWWAWYCYGRADSHHVSNGEVIYLTLKRIHVR